MQLPPAARSRFVSTGHLPPADRVQAHVDEAHRLFSTTRDGECSQVYPALACVSSDLFGICIVNVEGRECVAGDVETTFAIMSAVKPFVFALACMAVGTDTVRSKVGINATGLAYNSVAAVERDPQGRTNPMVNSGAIVTTSLIPGDTREAKWSTLLKGLSRFAGRQLEIDDEVYRSASETNHRNRAIAHLLRGYGLQDCDPDLALDLYTRQSSLKVTARDLAIMGATLAHGGVNPVTREAVVSQEACRAALVVMTIAGLYETSGDWLWDVGLPGKSGIGGGVVTVSPGKGGLGTYSPLLDAAGNSVRGQLAAAYLSRKLGLDLFVSPPEE